MNRKSVMIFSAVAVAGLVLLVFYFESQPKPEAMLRTALSKFKETRYLHSQVTVESFVPSASLSIGPDNKPKVDSSLVPVKATGSVDLHRPDGAAPKSRSHFSIVLGSALSRAEVASDAITDGTGTTYFRISGLPATSEAGLDIGKLNDRWLSMDRRALGAVVLQKNLSATPGAGAAAVAASGFSGLFDQFVSGGLFSIDRRMVNEFVAGHPTRHFAVRFDKAALGLFAASLAAAVEDRPVAPADIESETARVGVDYSASGEIWIDAKTFELRRFGVELQPVSAERASLPVRVVAEFGGDRSPFDVSAPSGASPFVDVVKREVLTR